MPRILVATPEGLHTFDGRGLPGPLHHDGRDVTGLAPAWPDLWAVIERTEVWHADDPDGWTRVADLETHRATCIVAVGEDVFVGSSEARLFRLAGGTLEPVAAFDHAAGRSTWYTPWGGPPDTRSMANWDQAIYVNVHVGGILRTDDGGETWRPTIDIDADVHQVTTADGLVLAACAGGLEASSDGGEAWTLRSDGLEAPYSRGVAVCGDAVLVSASNGPRGGRGGVYRGALAGGALERCRTGVPQWFDDNIDSYCLDAMPDGTLAAFGTADGRLFASEDTGLTWRELASGLPSVQRVLVMP